MKQQFLKGKSGSISLTVYDNNRPIIPTSAKITLYEPAGGTLQAQADASVDATTGAMSYGLTATHTATNQQNYKAEWEYVVNGVSYYRTQLFDVVLSVLSIPITDDNLFTELESLKKTAGQVTGTVTSAATGTIVDTKRKEPADYWKGGTVEIISGTGAEQVRDVTGFVQSTSTLSVTPNWSTTPDTTSVYRLVRSFTNKIAAAFEELCTMIDSKGKRHELILESSELSIPLIYLTIANIALDLSDETDDKWDKIEKAYRKKFDTFFGALTLNYDEDESGSIDGKDEVKQKVSSFTIGRC